MHEDGFHRCGGLPVSTTAVTVWRCEHHMAWWARIEHLYDDGSEGAPHVVDALTIELGPFDDLEDVLAWVQPRLRAFVRAQALPGASATA